MNNGIDKIIGTGWAFPPSFDPITNRARMVTGEEDIYQSLQVLFGTQIGERVLELKYGTDLSALLFERLPLNEKAIMENAIRRAVIFYEARITLHELNIDDSDLANGILSVNLDFSIDHTNNRRNMVFPFFVKEGTLIPKF